MSGPERLPAERPAGGRTALQKRTGERLVALLVAGGAVLNYPLLSALRGRGLVAGIPALFVYLFLVWAGLALATALVLRRRPPDPEGPDQGPGTREP